MAQVNRSHEAGQNTTKDSQLQSQSGKQLRHIFEIKLSELGQDLRASSSSAEQKEQNIRLEDSLQRTFRVDAQGRS